MALVMLSNLLIGCAPASWPGGHAQRPATGLAARRAPTGAARSITWLGPTDPGRVLALSLVLAGRASDRLSQSLGALNDPSSPQYHHYLTPAQFAQQFGASPADEAQIEYALRAAGLSVTPHAPGSLLLPVRGSVRQIEALFGVRIEDYRTADGRVHYAATSAPRLLGPLAGRVVGVLGLDDQTILPPTHAHPADQPGTNGYTPGDLASAYDLGPLQQAGLDGSGQTIALAEIDTFRPSDISSYDSTFGITALPVKVIPVDGGGARPQDVSETTLDIEVIHAIAPQVHILAYEGMATFQGLADLFNRIVTDDHASVVSISLGICEPYLVHPETAPPGFLTPGDLAGPSFMAAITSTFQQADAQGMSVLVSSGDSGAYGCSRFNPDDHTPSVSAPASSPYVTAVGGTALFLNSDGSYNHEAGWEDPLEGAGGGGGLSIYYQQPNWQTGPGTNNQYSNGMREVPDVSADADTLTGYAIYDSSRFKSPSACRPAGSSGDLCFTIIGGTSAAAPLWASLTLLANQAAAAAKQAPLGFLNPALYSLGSSTTGASAFHDVTVGGNLLYPATPGWDLSTGWGSPDAAVLVQDLLNLTAKSGSGGGG
jgi:kumamolisin